VSAPTELRFRPTPKLAVYLALAALGLLTALAIGRPEPAVLATPVALAAVVGLALPRPEAVGVAWELERDRATENEDVVLTVRIEATAAVGTLELAVALPAGLTAPRPQRLQGVRIDRAGAYRFDVPVHCHRWGRYELDSLWIRTRSWFDLLVAEHRHHQPLVLRVYPRPASLRRLVSPRDTHTAAGSHVARAKGAGLEFADFRQFVPGDRVRDVSWKATARTGSLWVAQRHPDRAADVVILLDVFDEPELATAVRAANAVATAYLVHRDRVGLVSFGGLMRWLRPGMGARQQYVIVDMLLGTSVFDSVAWRDIDAVPPKALPPKALVIALSPLLDRRAIGAIIDLRRRGIDVVVVEVSPLPFAPATPGVNGEVAHRLWQLQRALVRDRFAELGVPVVVWDPRRALAVTIEEIAAWPTARRLVR